MKNRDIYWRRYRKHCTQNNDASVPFKVGTLRPHTVLSIAISCPVVFSLISLTVWNLFPFKVDFSFGKSQKLQGTNSGLYGGWVIWVIWCFTKNLCTRHDAWVGALSWWSCQSPVAHSCCLLNHPNSFCREEYSSLTWNSMKIHCSIHSVFLNVTATQYTCSLNGIYLPHWLVQWSVHCSHIHIPVHPPWPPAYQCHTNHSPYVNKDWTFSGQISCRRFEQWYQQTWTKW